MNNNFSSEVVVSVVCLAYNHEKYLKNALDGFLIQKVSFTVEFIIADDCSSDKTVDIINEYKNKFNDNLIVIKNKSNLGFMKNFINAMNSAKGKYIAICEGDDYWIDPDKLSIQVNNMDKRPEVNLSFHSSYIKYDASERADLLFWRRAQADCVFNIGDVLKSSGSFMPTASIMLRGDAYRNLDPCIRNLYASYTTAFFTQLIFSLQKGSLYIDRPMSVYRSMSAGSWTESVVNSPELYILWHDKYLDAIRSYNRLTSYKYRRLFKEAIADKHFSILKYTGVSMEYKNEYFFKNKSELEFWQIMYWYLIRYFPGVFSMLRKGRITIVEIMSKANTLIRGS